MIFSHFDQHYIEFQVASGKFTLLASPVYNAIPNEINCNLSVVSCQFVSFHSIPNQKFDFSCELILKVDIGKLMFVHLKQLVHLYELILVSFKVDFHESICVN